MSNMKNLLLNIAAISFVLASSNAAAVAVPNHYVGVKSGYHTKCYKYEGRGVSVFEAGETAKAVSPVAS